MDIPADSNLPVSIYHSSIRDYVSDPSNCGLPEVQHIMSPHSLLARSCLRLMIRDIHGQANMTLLDALLKLEGQSQAMQSDDPRELKYTLSFIVKPPEPLQVVIYLLWLRGGRCSGLQDWLGSLDGHSWLQTRPGKDWLQSRGGQEWLQTRGGQEWLLTPGGQEWLLTLGGQEWLWTQSGKEWLQAPRGQEWLLTPGGQEWLQTQGGQEWLQTQGGKEWLQTQGGKEWLQTQGGQEWLQTPGGKEWLQIMDGQEWHWLHTRGGQCWLQTVNMHHWLRTHSGQYWLKSPGGRDWLKGPSGRDWMQIPDGQAWQFTPAASIWVIMENLSSTLEAMNECSISPELLLSPAFQAIQNFKSLPDFLMFPVFLALLHHDNPVPAFPHDLPEMDIIHAMTAFTIFAGEAQRRSQSASDALKYACQNFAVHLSQAPKPWDDNLHLTFKSFWNHHLLFWLERQWCLKGLRSCLVILSVVQRFAKVCTLLFKSLFRDLVHDPRIGTSPN